MPYRPILSRFLPALAALALVCAATAQADLFRLAPPDSAMALTFEIGGSPAAELREDLAALDWQGARDTVQALLTATGSDFSDLPPMVANALDQGPGPLTAALDEACPSLGAVFRSLGTSATLPAVEALFSMHFVGAEPDFTLLVGMPSASAASVQLLRATLRVCADEVVSDESEDGTTLELLRFGMDGDGAVITVTDEGLLIAATDAPAIRAVLARADEQASPGALFTPFERFEAADLSLGFAIRPGAVIEALELTIGAAEELVPGDEALVSRVLDALETIESFTARWSVTETEATAEWSLAVDAEGPDQELVDLLLCPDCRISRPFLAPAGAVAVSSGRFHVEEFVDYISGFMAAAGLPFDLQAFVLDETGIDLDRDLLDWLGDEIHAVMLEPQTTDLRSLLYTPGQAFMVPVASEEAARAGLARLEEALVAFLEDSEGSFELPYAIRESSYDGFEFSRVQTSANVDLAVGLVGNHLVVATPATAFERIVDTFQGGANVVGEARYRELLAAVPRQTQALSLQDTSAQLQGLADLARLFSQPAAFVLGALLIVEESTSETGMGGWVIDLEEAAITEFPLEGLSEAALVGELTEGAQEGEGDSFVDGMLSDLYRLTGLEDGDSVTVVMESAEFDTMLYLIDGTDGTVIDYNDDAPDTSRSELVFTAQPGVDYLVQATSFGGYEVGEYSLAAERVAAEAPVEAAELPTFAQVLDLFELPAQVLEVLAEHIGRSWSYSITDGNVVFSRSTTELAR